jgi:hypothetical protein
VTHVRAPTLAACQTAAEAFSSSRERSGTTYPMLGGVAYLFWLEWSVRYGGSRLETESDILELPRLEEQVWDCSEPITEILDPDGDRVRVYFSLLDFLKSVAADSVRPFRFEFNRRKEVISYE